MPAQKKIEPELLSFGAEVRRLRKAAGYNQEDLARLVNVTRSYVAQVESGHTRCRRDFAVRLDGALKSGTVLADAWDDLLEAIKTSRYPAFFVDFGKAEASAIMLRAYEERIVYGLFQTEAYARVLLLDDDAVKARMRRQEILTKPSAPMVSVVLDVTVLYRELGSPEVMREQLEYLIHLSLRERINIQVAPIRYIRNVWGTFAIATQADQRQAAYVSKAYGGETSTEAAKIAHVSETFVTLQAEAFNARETRTFIRRVIDDRWT